MILTDIQIKELIDNQQLIIEGVNLQNLHSVSYDLTIDGICIGEGSATTDSYMLRHGEYIYAKSQEKLSIPSNLLGRIAERNSVMRMGLFVSAPHYQPGHKTYVYFRIINLSYHDIEIKKGFPIAQIMFEQLTDNPYNKYGERETDVYQNEFNYTGLNKYKNEYDTYIKKAEKAKEELDATQSKIYTNILTFMGIFVSIFSFIIFNFGTLASGGYKIKDVLITNVSLGLIISVFLGLVLLVVNTTKKRLALWIMISLIFIFLVALTIILFIYL